MDESMCHFGGVLVEKATPGGCFGKISRGRRRRWLRGVCYTNPQTLRRKNEKWRRADVTQLRFTLIAVGFYRFAEELAENHGRRMCPNTYCPKESIVRRQQQWGLVYGRPKKVRKQPICNKNLIRKNGRVNLPFWRGVGRERNAWRVLWKDLPWPAAAVAVWCLLQKQSERKT